MTRTVRTGEIDAARLEPLARLLEAAQPERRIVILCKAAAEAGASVAWDVEASGWRLSLHGATTAPARTRAAALRDWVAAAIDHFGQRE